MVQDDSDDPASTCSDKNFSMRDYVLAVRKRDISHNWPFPPKYLRMCVERGINRVLPPFDSRGLAIRYPTHEGQYCLSLDPSQEEKIVLRCALRDAIRAITKMEGTDHEHEKGMACMEGEIAHVSERVCLLPLSAGHIDEHDELDRCSAGSAAKFKGGTVKGTHPPSGLDHELLEVSTLHQDAMSCFEVSDLPKGTASSVLDLKGQNEVIDDFVSVSGNEDNDNHGSTVGDQIPELGHAVIHPKAQYNSFAKANLSSGQRSENKSRRKGKPKKRTMADICARARPSSLGDLDRVNGSNWANDSSLMPYNSSLSYVDNVCSAFDERRASSGSTSGESERRVRCSTKKHARDESSRDKHPRVKKRRIVVKKLTGMSKSRQRNLIRV